MPWQTESLPDSDMTVLLRLRDDDEPLAVGYVEIYGPPPAYGWRRPGGAPIDSRNVAGWMDIHEAAEALDLTPNILR